MTKNTPKPLKRDLWLAGLSPASRTVAATAIAVNKNIVEGIPVVGACYHLTFFLFEYLRSMHGIDVEPVIGWVNDGRDAFMIGHAWIEFEGKKTDVSLTRTEYPEKQLSGALIVLDEIIRPGEIGYTYHREREPEALTVLRTINPEVRAELEERQARMSDISRSPKKIRQYLKAAPPELSFGKLLAALRQGDDAG